MLKINCLSESSDEDRQSLNYAEQLLMLEMSFVCFLSYLLFKLFTKILFKLFAVVRKKHPEKIIIKEIQNQLDAVAEINAKNSKGKTVLDIAKKKNYNDLVDFLLERSAPKGEEEAEGINNEEYIQNQNYIIRTKHQQQIQESININGVNQQVMELVNLLGLQLLPLPDGKIFLTEVQIKKLEQVDREGNTQLLRIAMSDIENTEALGFLIRCGIDVSYQNSRTKQSAIDIVWEKGYYKSMLMLLDVDSNFPKDFTLNAFNQDDQIPKELKNFVTDREKLHKWIRNNKFEEVNGFILKNKLSKFLCSDNKSALETAAEYASVETLAALSGLQLPLKEIILEEHQLKFLKHVNKEGNTLLSIAAMSGKNENVDFLLKCGIDINHCNKFHKSAIDLAWKNQHYNVVLALLKSDSDFPKKFTLDSLNEENSQEKLKQFVSDRERFHNVYIKDGNFQDVKKFITCSKSKLYLNSKNQSSVFTTIKNKRFDIYAFLRSIGVNFRDKDEEKSIVDLSQGQKDHLKVAMLSYFTPIQKSHIFHLISKSRSKGPVENFQEKISGFYEKLDCIIEISAILKVIQYTDYLDVIFDFDNENIQDMNPNASETTKGTTDYKDGRLYIAAKVREDELLGTLAHELTHLAMQILYENDCNPYSKSDTKNIAAFKQIATSIKNNVTVQQAIKNIENNPNVDNSPIVILAQAFKYPEDEQHAELIVRIPHILAQYGKDVESIDFSDLKLYYTNNVLSKCNDFIEQSFLIKPRNTIKLLNEIVGEVSYIKKLDIQFQSFVDLEEFFNNNNKQILLLSSESTLLSSLRIYQTLQDSAEESLFFKFDCYVKQINEINKAFYSDVSKLLVIEYLNCSDHRKLESVVEALSTLFSEKPYKKVIFISDPRNVNLFKSILEKKMSGKCLEQLDIDFKFSDLTSDLQKRFLEENIVNFEGQKEKISLGELIGFDVLNNNLSEKGIENLLNDIVDLEVLVKLIKGEEITIGKRLLSVSDLECAYNKFYKKVDKNILMDYLSSQSDEIIILSGTTKNQFVKSLNIKDDRVINIIQETRQYTINSTYKLLIPIIDQIFTEKNFKKLCCANPDKKIYWMQCERNIYMLRLSYNPTFYIERYLKKILIRDSIREKFKEDILLRCFTLNKSLFMDLLSDNLQEDKKQKVFNWIPEYVSKIRNCLIIDEQYQKQITILTDNDATTDGLKTLNKLLRDPITIEMLHAMSFDYNPQTQFEELKKHCQSLHCLKIEEVNNVPHLIWQHSYGSLNVLQPYINKNLCVKFKGDEFLDQIKTNKAAIIIDDPGMGKSTTLTVLSEVMCKSHWVMRINLKDHQDAIDTLPGNIDINDVLGFLENTYDIDSQFARNLVKHMLKHKKVKKPLLLFFDGFDEIKSHCIDDPSKYLVNKLFKFLKTRTQASIVVTAQEHEKNNLESSLSVFAIQFEPLEESKQKTFLKEHWKRNLKWSFNKYLLDKQLLSDSLNSKLNMYVEQLLKVMNTVLMQQNTKLMGIPLTLRLLAESYQGRCIDFVMFKNTISLEDFNDLSILTIYQNIIDGKFKTYFKEKLELPAGLKYEKAKLQAALTKEYWKLAALEIFADIHIFQEMKDDLYPEVKISDAIKYDSSDNSIKYDEFDDELIALTHIGLIIRSDQSGGIEFIHRTFAEYFVAELQSYLLTQYQGLHPNSINAGKSLITKILLQKPYKVIRFFLNGKLGKQKLPIYRQNVTNLSSEKQELSSDEEELQNEAADLHRQALRIAAHENNDQIIHLLKLKGTQWFRI